MRVLVQTNQFREFTGAEVVALEVARWFHAEGDEVTIVANDIDDPAKSCVPEGIGLEDTPTAIDLPGADLVWSQHNMLHYLPVKRFEAALDEGRLPHVALVSLSPYEPFETVDAPLARAVTGDVYVNSPETAKSAIRQGHGMIDAAAVHVFHNAAPAAFWASADATRPASHGAPGSILAVSNHVPPELDQALDELRRGGIAVRCIGAGRDYRLVQPGDIAEVDAVIAIGKSVPYAIAVGRPVYVYDRFGGDGWLTRQNFDANFRHNFSGRPAKRRLAPGVIAGEIVDGFADAAGEVGQLGTVADLRLLSLDHHLSALRRTAAERSAAPDRLERLRTCLADPWFRTHMEMARAKSRMMRRFFLAAHRRR